MYITISKMLLGSRINSSRFVTGRRKRITAWEKRRYITTAAPYKKKTAKLPRSFFFSFQNLFKKPSSVGTGSTCKGLQKVWRSYSKHRLLPSFKKLLVGQFLWNFWWFEVQRSWWIHFWHRSNTTFFGGLISTHLMPWVSWRIQQLTVYTVKSHPVSPLFTYI